MSPSHLLILLLLLVCRSPLAAQREVLRSGWEFQRISQEQAQGAPKSQGSDWESQYSVQHVDAAGQSLALDDATISAERSRLAAGHWQAVSLPHTAHVEPLLVMHQWQGICYYRRQLRVSRRQAQGRLWLEFGAAMHLADVWLNGHHLAQHSGGYTPFVVDVSGLLVPDQPNELLVRLDNRDNPLIPPGKPVADLDFLYYGGLYRDVTLVTKSPVHITHPIMAGEVAGGGVFVTCPQVSKAQAQVAVRTHVANTTRTPQALCVRQTLLEWTPAHGIGARVASVESLLNLQAGASAHVSQQMLVTHPRLWYPHSPALYVLRTQVLQDSRVVDSQDTRVGLRHIEFTRAGGFSINGQPLWLDGSNRHQEYPYVGYALPARAQYRDMWQIKNSGFNIVRLGHYPQDPSVLDACDELGLLAIEPIPGWQFFNQAPQFVRHTMQDVRDLIRRDRNHPSIVMWETTLNESWPPDNWKDQAVRTAHEEYPGPQCYTSGDAYGYDGFDVCYNDWAEGFHRPNRTAKAGFIREYYDYEFGGHYSTSRVSRGQGDRALVQNAWNAQWSHNRYRAQYPSTAGAAVWSMYDYNRGYDDDICLSGVADLFRLPKFSLHYFRSQVAAGTPLPSGPMPYEVYACTHWQEDSPSTVQVYGNVDEVELLLNGRSLGRRRPDAGPTTEAYVAQPDGGNATHVCFPPFTFAGLTWEPGTLEAVGYHDGHPVAHHVVRTPGRAASLAIDYFQSGRPAARHDLIIVYVRVQDEAGTLLFGENRREVHLQVLQGGTVCGPQWQVTEAGIASFLVATDDASALRLRATSGTLQSDCKIRLVRD